MSARVLQRFSFGVPAEQAYGYSQAVRVGETIYISGQLSHDERGEFLHAGDCGAQLRQTFANLSSVLDVLGSTRRQVVQTRLFVVGLQKHLAIAAEEHRLYFDGSFPASTAVGVSELLFPGQVVELEAVVRLDERR